MSSITLFSCSGLSEYDNLKIQNALADSLFNSTESWAFDLELFEEKNKVLSMTGSHSVTIKRKGGDETRISGPVYIQMFNDGKQTTMAQSDSALYLPSQEQFELFGSVKVMTDSTLLITEYLRWDRNDDRVSTDRFVEFITPPDSITSVGFYGNSALTEYTLNQMSGKVVIE